MWRHPSRTVPVNSRRRNDNDDDTDALGLGRDGPACRSVEGQVEAAGSEHVLWQMLFISCVFAHPSSLPETRPLAIDRRPYSLCSFLL